jgi:hypothetical protein
MYFDGEEFRTHPHQPPRCPATLVRDRLLRDHRPGLGVEPPQRPRRRIRRAGPLSRPPPGYGPVEPKSPSRSPAAPAARSPATGPAPACSPTPPPAPSPDAGPATHPTTPTATASCTATNTRYHPACGRGRGRRPPTPGTASEITREKMPTCRRKVVISSRHGTSPNRRRATARKGHPTLALRTHRPAAPGDAPQGDHYSSARGAGAAPATWRPLPRRPRPLTARSTVAVALGEDHRLR